MDVDAVIAEATNVAPDAKATEVAEAVETPEVVNEPVAPTKPEIKPDSELTPEQLAKRESNRRAHQASKEARLKREVRELREFKQQMEAQRANQRLEPNPQNTANPTGEPQPPKEEDFNDWEILKAAERKYIKDLARWEARQELSERDNQTKQYSEAEKLANYWEERKQTHASKEAEYAAKVPDYQQRVYGDYADFMQNLPATVQEALIEADDAASALYALAMEGRLESLEDMPANRVALEIGRAEIRGQQYLNRKTVTNAPPPVESAKGTGKPSKDLIDLPMDQLLSRLTR